MFSAGTTASLASMGHTLKCHGILVADFTNTAAPTCTDNQIYPTLCGFIVFFITFARFYLGDVRIFDARYSEVYLLVVDNIDLQATSTEDARRDSLKLFVDLLAHNDKVIFKLEGIWLLFQTLIVVFLGFNIETAENFLRVYMFLLFCNSAWLLATYFKLSPVVKQITDHILSVDHNRKSWGVQFARQASIRWFWNNAICCAVIVAAMTGISLFPSQREFFHEIGYATCVINCIVDLSWTINFYFPRFSKEYQNFIEAVERNGSFPSPPLV
jgi:hypothetical protein